MIKRLFILRRSSLRLLLPIVAFLFSAIAGISVAAWLDAPNAPPNYGLTPPFTQNDFKPMNLGTTPQTKRGSVVVVGTLIATSTTPTSFPNFPGNVVASGFYDSEDTSYFLDPASMGGYSGVFSSSIGIRQHSPNASLSVNNYYDILDPLHPKETLGKVGSSGDAIYAYTNSTGAAISAEQGNPTGYAVYASGGINFFGGDVKVGSATSPKSLCINDDCKTEWPSGVWTQTGNDIYNNNTGNVGIGTGTASPQANLHVGGSTRIDGPANTCKKISYSNTTSYQIGHAGATPGWDTDLTYRRAAPAVTMSCGANYYVIGAINTSGHFGNPATPPSSGSLLCCKNAD